MCGVNLSVFHCIPLVVILGVLTIPIFIFSLVIRQLMAKAIPVRGAIFREARSGKPERAFCFLRFKFLLSPALLITAQP
ncbi:hypothetical protein [Pantoea sp. Nvir]|uniref:hypothetical protein n=1 Tax=Pantoea sp. Nvir TaxID=2576760 RepID=UPI0030D5E69B